MTKGSILSGLLSDTYKESDNTNLVLNEVTGVYTDPIAGGGFTYDFEYGIFDDVPSSNVDLYFVGYYQGNPAHNVKLQQWNYTSSSWVNVTTSTNDFPSSATEQSYVFFLLDAADYISGGNIRLRIIHTSSGSALHYLYVNKLYLELGGPSASVSASKSPSASASVSKSPSASESASASASESASLSPSASASPSVSPSASLSPSASESVSLSPSASASPSEEIPGVATAADQACYNITLADALYTGSNITIADALCPNSGISISDS